MQALLQADSTLSQMEASVGRTNRHSTAFNSTVQQLNSEVDALRSELKRKEAEIVYEKQRRIGSAEFVFQRTKTSYRAY